MNWVIQDRDNYLHAVAHAVYEPECFKEFRRNENYCQILEHVTRELGFEYLAQIRDPIVRQLCLNSEYADTIGHPKTFIYEDRKLSPTTLRYGKVLNDLLTYFPQFKQIKSIVEIGIGYGGQARLISEYTDRVNAEIQSYSLVDIALVLELSRIYLSNFAASFCYEFLTLPRLASDVGWDLCISNYAFSEFNRTLQEEYLKSVLLKSRCGYLTMNSGLNFSLMHYGVDELLTILPNAKRLVEWPTTGIDNYLIVYGEHSA